MAIQNLTEENDEVKLNRTRNWKVLADLAFESMNKLKHYYFFTDYLGTGFFLAQFKIYLFIYLYKVFYYFFYYLFVNIMKYMRTV